MPKMPAKLMVAPGMPPPTTPLPTNRIGGFAGSMTACERPSDATAVLSSKAQLFCAVVGSGLVGCVMVPVNVTPARVGFTSPLTCGTADSRICMRYVPLVLSSWIFSSSPAPDPPVYVVP